MDHDDRRITSALMREAELRPHQAGPRRGLARPRNAAIGTEDYPTPARRPLNSRLSSDLAAATFGVSVAGFEEAVPRVLDEILASA